MCSRCATREKTLSGRSLFPAQTATAAISPAACVIEFLGKPPAMGSGAAKHHITLRVDGENQTEKSQTFAAVEEQIERTLMSPWPAFSVALILIGVLLLTLFLVAKPAGVRIGSELSPADVLQLGQLASDAKSADDKLNLLFELRHREIHSLAGLYEPVHIEQFMTLSALLKTLVLVGLI